jgi:hypothetical protein
VLEFAREEADLGLALAVQANYRRSIASEKVKSGDVVEMKSEDLWDVYI